MLENLETSDVNIMENLSQYYERLPFANPEQLSENNGGPGHFNVFLRAESSTNVPFNRRDFYKVSLILSTGQLYYANRSILIDRPALVLSSPLIPYSWEPDTVQQEGWFCIFFEKFIPPIDFKNFILDSPLFRTGGTSLFCGCGSSKHYYRYLQKYDDRN